jgi:hypothetical protein
MQAQQYCWSGWMRCRTSANANSQGGVEQPPQQQVLVLPFAGIL